jgi:hypothetical protein
MATYSAKLYPFNSSDQYAMKEHLKKKYVSKLFMEKEDSAGSVDNSSDSDDEPKKKKAVKKQSMTAKKSKSKKLKDFE